MLLFYLSNTAAENPPFLVNLLLPSPIKLAFVVHWKSLFFLIKETGGAVFFFVPTKTNNGHLNIHLTEMIAGSQLGPKRKIIWKCNQKSLQSAF